MKKIPTTDENVWWNATKRGLTEYSSKMFLNEIIYQDEIILNKQLKVLNVSTFYIFKLYLNLT